MTAGHGRSDARGYLFDQETANRHESGSANSSASNSSGSDGGGETQAMQAQDRFLSRYEGRDSDVMPQGGSALDDEPFGPAAAGVFSQRAAEGGSGAEQTPWLDRRDARGSLQADVSGGGPGLTLAPRRAAPQGGPGTHPLGASMPTGAHLRLPPAAAMAPAGIRPAQPAARSPSWQSPAPPPPRPVHAAPLPVQPGAPVIDVCSLFQEAQRLTRASRQAGIDPLTSYRPLVRMPFLVAHSHRSMPL